MASTKKSEIIIPQKPDNFIQADFDALFNEVFSPDEEHRVAVIEALDVDKKVAFYAYLRHRAAQFNAVADVAAKSLRNVPVDQFSNPNTLISVYDDKQKEIVGGVHIYTQTVTTTKLSTEDKKTRTKVIEGLDKAIKDGVLTQDQVYGTKDSTGMIRKTLDLQNDALFAAKAAGQLPTNVSDLLVKNIKSEDIRVTDFIDPKSLPKEKEDK